MDDGPNTGFQFFCGPWMTRQFLNDRATGLLSLDLRSPTRTVVDLVAFSPFPFCVKLLVAA